MLKYEIEGGSLPVVICYPEQGQTLCTERGSMGWMSPNMQMETNSGGGVKKALGRLIAGESLFVNEFTPVNGTGMIAFTSSFPGGIIPYQVTPGNGIVVQKKGFLAMEKGLDVSVFFQHKAGAGFFGGEGFVMQRITGNGLVFIEIDGNCKEYELSAGESIVVNTGHLAAMSESCSMSVEAVKGLKNVLLGGSGAFHTIITGPGKVYLQSMPISKLANAVEPYLPQPTTTTTNSNGSGGISFKIGG